MGRSLGCEYEDSLETYNIISQMKKLKPTELKNLFEAMVNSLTIPTKEGLVFLVWEGLEPHERDLFNFPSNDIYSESIKDSYLEIFQHNQPLSSIWNNNDVTRRNRIRNRNIYSSEDDFETYTRRRLDFNSIIDQLFDTSVGLDITPGSWSSLNSNSGELDSSTFSSPSGGNSGNNTNNNSDNENENENENENDNDNNNDNENDNDNENENEIDNDRSHSNASNNTLERQRVHRHPPILTRRQLIRRFDRMSSPSISIPTSISNSTYPYYQRIRMTPSSSSRRSGSSNSNSGAMNTRFVSTERRTMTVNNNDIRTFHVISRNNDRSQESLNNLNSNSNTITTENNDYHTNSNTNTNNSHSNNESNSDFITNNYLQRRRHHHHHHHHYHHHSNNDEESGGNNSINFSPDEDSTNNHNYIYDTSFEPRNIVRVSSGINLNLFDINDNRNHNNIIINDSDINSGGSSMDFNINTNINTNSNQTTTTTTTNATLPTIE